MIPNFIDLINTNLLLICSLSTVFCWAGYHCVECRRRANKVTREIIRRVDVHKGMQRTEII